MRSHFLNSIVAFLLLFVGGFSCSDNDNPQVNDILLLSTNPEENSIISIDTESFVFTFNRGLLEVDKSKITLNGTSVPEASVQGALLTVKPGEMEFNLDYEVIIQKDAFRDNAKNLNKQSFSLKFKTDIETIEPPINPPVDTIRLEAENAILSGGGTNSAMIANDPTCSGGKYVDVRDGNLKFSFAISQAGNYKITAKIKASYGDKVNKFRINGEHTIDFSILRNNSFEEFIIADPYYFSTGNHTIEMINEWGWFLFDYLEISPSTAVEIEFDIQPLVTPQPTPNTAKLFQFLLDNFQRKIISGAMTLKSLATTTGNQQNEISWLYERTGKKPAMLGLDFMDHVGAIQTDWINNPDIIKDAITWKNSNGIVTICWHWRDPSHKTYEFYTNRTTFDPRKIFEPQSDEYDAMMRDMDIIAEYLKELQQQDIPILWRPLHEASGTWFWWGAQGPEACKKIWHIMFDKFVNEHDLRNLIWVWTSEANSKTMDWYPGDEYVDIIGLDIYEEGNHGSQMLAFAELKRMYNGKKLITLSEIGSIPSMEAMKRDKTIWSYYMPWYGAHTKTSLWNHINVWITSFNDPDVITLDDMPNNFYH